MRNLIYFFILSFLAPIALSAAPSAPSYQNYVLSREEIVKAYEFGNEAEATHMLVIWDTYEYEDSYDFILYCFPGEDVETLIEYYDAPGFYRVSAVYAMHLDIYDQLENGNWFPDYPE